MGRRAAFLLLWLLFENVYLRLSHHGLHLFFFLIFRHRVLDMVFHLEEGSQLSRLCFFDAFHRLACHDPVQ